MRSLGLLAATVLAGACTHQADVPPSSAPAAEVLPQKVASYPVSMYIDPSLSALKQDATTGFTCSFHTFPVNVGPAIASSLRIVNMQAFKDVAPGGDRAAPAPGAVRHIIFEPEAFTARLDFAAQFFTARAIGNSELVMRVRALNQNGIEILRSMVSGSGSGDATGGCDAGATALEIATGDAVRRAVDNYVFKVINTEQLKLTDSERARLEAAGTSPQLASVAEHE